MGCWFETVAQQYDFAGAMSAWSKAPVSGGKTGGTSSSSQPASGGGVPSCLAPCALSGRPKWKCRQTKPWQEKMHCWRFTKSEAGARVEMRSGDWNKEQLQAEVEAHEEIWTFSPMQNKLKNSR